jgi:hypothetical protein
MAFNLPGRRAVGAPGSNHNQQPTRGLTNDMNKQAFDEKVDEFIKEEYAALSPETLRQFDEETIDELVKAAFIERMKAEAQRNPQFKDQAIEAMVHYEINRWLAERHPNVSYRPDGLIVFDNKICKEMSYLKHRDLLAWAAIESDPANLRYIVDRIAAWDQTKHETIDDLERDLAATKAQVK